MRPENNVETRNFPPPWPRIRIETNKKKKIIKHTDSRLEHFSSSIFIIFFFFRFRSFWIYVTAANSGHGMVRCRIVRNANRTLRVFFFLLSSLKLLNACYPQLFYVGFPATPSDYSIHTNSAPRVWCPRRRSLFWVLVTRTDPRVNAGVTIIF